jgi:probable rRNA maturation factor
MPAINFFTQDVNFNLKDKTALRGWISATAKKEGSKIAALNYIFSSDKFLHQLNEQYLHHDNYTDIITFDLGSPNSQLPTSNLQGEIFISIERIKENAKVFKTTFKNELHRVMIHGMLHLSGYKDKTKADKTIMRKKEDYYLNLRSF